MRRTMLVCVAVLGLLAAACGNNGTTPSASPTTVAGGTVNVSLKEYSVTPAPTSAAAGSVTFAAKNDGTMNHELVVFKTALAPDKLPVKDALVNETGEGLDAIGEIEEFAAKTSQSATFELAAGSYVLICNVAGHYSLGMRAAFTVT